ncbi:MAG: hypothetical protein Q7T47_04205, partial [Anaerolineales bacterium]|nr:hypothetical protein [Anaerolineales bacterium]
GAGSRQLGVAGTPAFLEDGKLRQPGQTLDKGFGCVLRRVGAAHSTYSAHDTPKAFLQRLAGLAKFAILKKSGRTRLSELAAACAQPEIAVRLGLEWLAANGNIVFEADGDALQLSIGNQAANQYLPKADRQQELSLTIQALLAETRAYRTFFTRADKDTLLIDYNTVEELR